MSLETRSPAVSDELAKIERSWRRLNAELDGIPHQRMLEPGAVGVWSVKDLLGHIAFWDEEAIKTGTLHLAGQPDPNDDVEAINTREAALRADRGLDEQWEEMRTAHAALVAYLRGQPGTDRDLIGLCGCLREYTHQHYDEHTADLRAWRDRVDL